MKQSLLKKLWLRTSMLVAVILCGAGTAAWGQVAKIGDVEYGTLAAAVDAATGEQQIDVVTAGTYTLPNLPQNITINGAVDGVVFTHTSGGNICSVSNGVTFKNVAFNFADANYHGFQHAGTINMEGCVINGRLTSYGDMNFTNCQLVKTDGDYNMWVYGKGTVNYTNCTFTGNGKFLHCYSESSANIATVNISGCKFINTGAANKAAINVKSTCGTTPLEYHVTVTNCTTEGAFPAASTSDALIVFNELIQVDDRNSTAVDNITISQDGTQLYAKGASTLIEISTVDELKAFRDAVNNNTSYAGKTVKLTADLDLKDEEWIPIGKSTMASYPGTAFKGNFDGCNHTISNLKVNSNAQDYATAGLFGAISVGSIKNLTLKNVDITSTHWAGGIVAYFSHSEDVIIENCHVIGGTIKSTPELLNGSYDNGDKVGGIVGYATVRLKILNCSVEDINIIGYRDLGSIGGYIDGTVTDCTAKDVTIVQDNKNGYKTEDLLKTCGEIVGGRSANAATVNSESSYSNVIINQIGLVAQIGNVKYQTLAAAVAAVPADGTETTIKMIEDETIVGNAGVTIPVGKNVVLDLNGKTVTLNVTESKGSQLLTNKGSLTITDGSAEQTGKLTNAADESLEVGSWPTNNYVTNIITNSGTLNVEGGNIVSTANGSICYAIDNNSTSYDAILNIKGGYLTSVGTVVRQFCNSTTKENVVNISGGVVETNGSAALWVQLPNSDATKAVKATLNVTGGTLTGKSYAFYDYSYGNSYAATQYNLNGGTFNGMIFSYGANINITDGVYNGDVAIKQAKASEVTVSGGKFKGDVYTYGDNASTGFITGGMFATTTYEDEGKTYDCDWMSLLAEGLACRANTDEATKDEYPYAVGVKVELAQPIIFHDGGEYEGELTVAIAGEGVKYTLNGEAEQTYSAPFTISDEGEYTIKAWVEQDGIKSSEVSKTFTIVAKQAGAEVADGYYNIKTNDGKFVNVAGRKTVTLVSDNEGKAGTVIRVNADAEGVKVLRSQGVDLPGYAKKAMNYVPEIVQLAVDKLHAEGAGELLGETGLEKIMDKFNESFDYNLYLEKDGEAYRIYGRTPSMKPVVDFYAENKANVDAKLPELEEFINKAIQKVLQKTNGSGASILVPFSLQTIWERMGSTLTNPADDEAKFYEEVLSSEANVWNFAYQTAMLYWGNLKSHPRFAEIQGKLGDYSKYIDKVENIRPNFKYYIVPSASGVDFISQGNSKITDASTAWTMESVSEFNVNFETEQAFNIYPTTSGGETIEAKEYYTTLYTDFAYTLPEGVKAYKVTEITEKYGVAKREEITGVIPAQTPVLLVTSNKGAQTLTLTTEAGTAVTGNLLVGADALINEYQIKTPQVVSLFDFAKEILGESAYVTYLKKYEHLMLKNAGTVGNKYFFGLTEDDINLCTEKNDNNEQDCVIRSLSTGDQQTGFYNNWKAKANQAFLVTKDFNHVKLFLVGDVNRDGNISISDVTALVNIILGKATYPKDNDKYDFAAANVNNDKAITISDVTALVNIILGK